MAVGNTIEANFNLWLITVIQILCTICLFCYIYGQ